MKWIKKKNFNKSEIIIHIVAWILYHIPMFGYAFGAQQNMSTNHFMAWVIESAIIEIPIFYFFYSFVIPRFLEKKQWSRFIISLLLVLSIYPFIKFYSDELVHSKFPGELYPFVQFKDPFYWEHLLARTMTILFVIFMSGFGRFTFDWFKNAQWKMKMENLNLTNELAFLKSQINPHFLFNTLNNIYTLAYKKADEAPDAIMKLSDLMRYMLYDSNVERIPLKDEIESLKGYVELQLLRIKNKEKLNIEIDKNINNVIIAPLLLIPFVENAFKHTDYKSADPIKIKLQINNNDLIFKVTNPYKDNSNKDEVGGIGLINLKRRLDLLYKNNYQLIVDKRENTFTSSLIIHKLK